MAAIVLKFISGASVKKIILATIFIALTWTNAGATGNTDTDLFDDIESLLQESDANTESRKKAEQQAKQQARESRAKNYTQIIINFEFPEEDCQFPDVYIPDSSKEAKRLNRHLTRWHKCLRNANNADTSAWYDLIHDLKGRWNWFDEDANTFSWGFDSDINEVDELLEQQWEQFKQRRDKRDSARERMETIISDHNEAIADEEERRSNRQSRRNFWNSVLQGIEQGLREINQPYYQQY
ncbi:MAG: hypothetical protein KAU22_01825 [Desulfuromonadales bacterium]|nr:hypothetical protein [Desulfuromonadales bacterium]